MIVLLLGAVAAMAAGIDGKWVAEVEGRDGGTLELTYTLKADGKTLSGQVSTPMGDLEISDGKINGSEVSFVVEADFQGSEVRFLHQGKLAGDELKIASEREDSGEVREFTAKRSGT